MSGTSRGWHLQAVYDLTAEAVQRTSAIGSVRDLFGSPEGQPHRTVLGQLFDELRPVLLEHAAQIGCGECGVCRGEGVEIDPRTGQRVDAGCPFAMTDLVEAFKMGARDTALKRELLLAAPVGTGV